MAELLELVGELQTFFGYGARSKSALRKQGRPVLEPLPGDLVPLKIHSFLL